MRTRRIDGWIFVAVLCFALVALPAKVLADDGTELPVGSQANEDSANYGNESYYVANDADDILEDSALQNVSMNSMQDESILSYDELNTDTGIEEQITSDTIDDVYYDNLDESIDFEDQNDGLSNTKELNQDIDDAIIANGFAPNDATINRDTATSQADSSIEDNGSDNNTALTSQAGMWESEPNDSKGDADYITVNNSWSGAISSTNDDDWYQFTLSSPSKVSLTFKHPYRQTGMGQWSLSIMKITGSYSYSYETIISCDVAGNKTSVTTTPVGLPSGEYLVRVQPYSSSYWSSATYNFCINKTASSAWEREFNNGKNDANSIAIGRRMYGTTPTSSDDDWYRFTLSSNKSVTLNFRHPYRNTGTGQWLVALYRNTGSSSWEYELIAEMTVSGNKTVRNMVRSLNSGDYLVRVRPYSDSYWSSATYNFCVTAQ